MNSCISYFIPAVNTNGNKTIFINGKPAVIIGLRLLRNSPSWSVIYLLVSFYKFSLFSAGLVTFIISFISLFLKVIPERVTDETYFLIFLQIILSPISIRILQFNYLVSVLFNSFTYEFATEFIVLNGGNKITIKPGIINPPNCTILNNWVFESSILADEPFAKALQIFETCVSVNNDLCGKLVFSNQIRL